MTTAVRAHLDKQMAASIWESLAEYLPLPSVQWDTAGRRTMAQHLSAFLTSRGYQARLKDENYVIQYETDHDGARVLAALINGMYEEG